ncbi:MAG: substrate-binding periplasmic protein [Bdellovibrionales bacterium]
MKFYFSTGLAVLLGAVLVLLIHSQSFSVGNKPKEASAYDRVMATHTLRCGYFPFSPNLVVDPNTGKKSGIFYELTEEIGRRLNLKIEWAEEVGYGVIAEGFETGRYDLFCNTVWPIPTRAQQAVFSVPLYYSPVGIFVRDDDVRFDRNYQKLNAPDYVMAVRDGDISDSITKTLLPKAKTVSVPELSGIDQPLLEVSTKKADAIITEPLHIYEFNKTSPVKLRNITRDEPVKYFPNTYMMGKSEFQLKQMLDVTIQELISEGYMDELLDKYVPEEIYPAALFKVAPPYALRR